MGGTMSTMYTALHQDKVRNLAVIAPVIDGHKDFTVIANLAKNMDVDKMLQVIGNLQSEQLYTLYLTLKPFKQGVNKYLNLLQNVNNEQFVGNFLRRSEEHTSELQSRQYLVCRLLLEKKNYH